MGMAHALGIKFMTRKIIYAKKKDLFHARFLNKINSIDKKKIQRNLKNQNHLISDSSIKLCGNKGQISVFSNKKKLKI